MFLLTCKVIFIATLATFFTKYFGYPSYQKYLKNQTLISETTVAYDYQKPPSLEILVSRSKYFNGWNQEGAWVNLSTLCNTSENYQKVAGCMEEKAFKLNDFLIDAKSGDESNTDITDPSYWNEGIGYFQVGKSFSINSSYTIGSDMPYFEVNLNRSLSYMFLIYDPNYYVPNTNPDMMPHVLLNMPEYKTIQAYIRAVYQTKMDKEERRCETSEQYSFTACVKNSISRGIGCRLAWDSWSSPDIPECTKVEQLLQFEEEYEKVHVFSRTSLAEKTGCHPPCSYTEYQLANDPLVYEEVNPRLIILLSSSQVAKRSEEYIYPIESFVSEFGGALGLFLGLSFMMIWETLEFSIKFAMKFKSKLFHH